MKNSLQSFDVYIKNACIYTMNASRAIYPLGCIGIVGKKIVYIGEPCPRYQAKIELDAQRNVITPGLIDCHTHLVYAGDRCFDFGLRTQGYSYTEIAAVGGGILSTVSKTQSCHLDTLFLESSIRLQSMLSKGTTTVEIKSGYGLDLDTELKILEVIKRLSDCYPLKIYPCYLGLHALPEHYRKRQDAYVEYVIQEILPQVYEKKLAIGVDAFCESIAFNRTQVERFFKAAQKFGFALKIHAEQLSHQGAADFAAGLGAVSIDHLEYLSEDDCARIKHHTTVAVLLPGAYYYLQQVQKPPIEALRKNKIAMAIATDCNPGSSPFTSLVSMMNFACLFFGLTIEEVWEGVTIQAAKALNWQDNIGSLEPGKAADLVIWNTDNLTQIVYQPDINFCQTVISNGKIIHNLPCFT